MPMTITPFETNLFRHLTNFFAEHQYVLLADKKQFRKTTATGFQNVIFSPSFYQDETWLEVHFGCRNDQVEQIAQQFLFSLPDYRLDADTILISIGKFNDTPYYRFKIRSSEDLLLACQQIEAFFTEKGFGFLNDSCTLPALDVLFNQQPNQPCRYVYNQTHRCYKGLITGRLNNNPFFTGLIDSYRNNLSRQTQSSHELLHFERLISYLLHYSAN